jgi:hypothetical protein
MADIPSPEPGLVICYSYLWHYERQTGRDEGRKNRPSVIILTAERKGDGATMVVVLPITHLPPANPDAAIEIPLAIKRHLGLDDGRSWVIVEEGNEFAWPGYDLRLIPNTGRYEYGFLPPRFFAQIVDAFRAWRKKQQRPVTSRD